MALPAYLTQVLIDHPVGLWALTDQAGSSTAADINPTENGPATPGTKGGTVTFGGAGPITGLGSALFAGAAGDKITTAVAPPLGGQQAISVEALIKLPALPAGDYMGIYSDSRITFRVNDPAEGGGIALFVLEQSGAEPRGQQSGALGLAAWHHVAATWDGANIIVYIDGLLSSTTARTGTMLPASGAATIGGLQSGSTTNPFSLFGVAVYNYALTGVQIANHYNAWQGATPEIYLPFPSGFQPWDVASANQIAAWYTEKYQGAGQGSPPVVGAASIVGVVLGVPTTKYWIAPGSVNPLA